MKTKQRRMPLCWKYINPYILDKPKMTFCLKFQKVEGDRNLNIFSIFFLGCMGLSEGFQTVY
jgi:hypothetical protein